MATTAAPALPAAAVCRAAVVRKAGWRWAIEWDRPSIHWISLGGDVLAERVRAAARDEDEMPRQGRLRSRSAFLYTGNGWGRVCGPPGEHRVATGVRRLIQND